MPSLEDLNDFEGKLRREIERIEDVHHEADQSHVRRFVNRMDGRIKDSSLQLYLQNLRLATQPVDGPLCEFDRDDLDDLIFRLRHDESLGRGDGTLSDKTVQNYQTALLRFLDVTDVEAEWVGDVEFVKTDKRTVDPGDMLQPPEVRALCDAAQNMRDVAFIEFLADTGARVTLAASLRVGDLDLDSERPTYTPNSDARGLKNADIREYPLIDSVGTLRTYLDRMHPRADEDGVAFFHKVPGHGRGEFDGDGSINTRTFYNQLQDIAERAGIQKPTNPHNFRHSAITRMRREGYDRKEVETRVCWTVDSDMWEVYEHISAEQANDAMFERAGMADAEEGSPDAERRQCGSCFEVVAPHHLRCTRCGTPADPELREFTDQAEDEGVEQVGFTEDDLERLVVQKTVELLRANDVQVDPGDVV